MSQIQLVIVILLLGGLGFGSVIARPTQVEFGKPAPDFTLMDQDSTQNGKPYESLKAFVRSMIKHMIS